jgi:hypothetical protein
MLVDEADDLFRTPALFIESTGQPIHVSTSSLGRRFLRSNPDDQGVDNLAALPECVQHVRCNLPHSPPQPTDISRKTEA